MKLSRSIFYVMFCSLFFVPTLSFAQVTVEGGTGLFHVDKADTIGDGALGLGAFYAVGNEGSGAEDVDETSLHLGATYGIGDRFEISIAAPVATRLSPSEGDEISGAADGLAKAKWVITHNQKHNLRLSAIALLNIPLGDKQKGLGTENADAGLALALDKEYEHISWHFNAGYYDARHEDIDVDARALYGAGVEYAPMEDLSFIAEVSGYSWSKLIPHRDDSTTYALGIRKELGEWGSADIGYSSKGAGQRQNYLYEAGLTIFLGSPHKRSRADYGGHGEAVATGSGSSASVYGGASGSGSATDNSAVASGAYGAGYYGKNGTGKGTLVRVHFAHNGQNLSAEGKQTLLDNLAELNKPGARIEIVGGHTSSPGSARYNERLGLTRAKAVKLFLVRQGVAPDRMFVISHGEKYPIADNATREGQAQNRRAEFEITFR